MLLSLSGPRDWPTGWVLKMRIARSASAFTWRIHGRQDAQKCGGIPATRITFHRYRYMNWNWIGRMEFVFMAHVYCSLENEIQPECRRHIWEFDYSLLSVFFSGDSASISTLWLFFVEDMLNVPMSSNGYSLASYQAYAVLLLIALRWTSKIKVAFLGMRPGYPRSPYARLPGIVKVAFSPKDICGTNWSQP